MISAVLVLATVGTAVATVCSPSPISLFSFGSSWTDTLWQVNGTSPSSNNPFGNGVYCSTNQQEYGCNYIDYLVEGKDQSGVYINKTLTLAYNYAHGGATVDNRVVFSSLQPSFYGQVQEFIGNGNVVHNYSDQARWGWNSANSIFVVFMGDNDIQIWANNTAKYNQSSQTGIINNLTLSYSASVNTLYNYGARNFLFVGTPAQEKSPLLVNGVTQTERDRYFPFKLAYDKSISAFANSLNQSHAGNGVNAVYYNTSLFMDKRFQNLTYYGYNPNPTCQEGNAPANLNCEGVGCCIWSNNFHATPRFHRAMAVDLASVMAKAKFPGFAC